MFELTNQAFTRGRPLLPANSRRGKPWRDHRQVLGGILWKLHTGRPWRDLTGRFGPWQTCYSRLRRWQRDGTWPRVWAAVLAADQAALRLRPLRSGAADGGASGSGGRGPGGGAATATTTAPGARWVVSTTPGRPAAAAPPRSRS